MDHLYLESLNEMQHYLNLDSLTERQIEVVAGTESIRCLVLSLLC